MLSVHESHTLLLVFSACLNISMFNFDPKLISKPKLLKYFKLFWFLVITNFATSLILSLAFVHSAKEMHEILLHYVLRWPMELFDVTPLGRVLNRFAKDVEIVDNFLPQVIKSWIFMFFAVIRQCNTNLFIHPNQRLSGIK